MWFKEFKKFEEFKEILLLLRFRNCTTPKLHRPSLDQKHEYDIFVGTAFGVLKFSLLELLELLELFNTHSLMDLGGKTVLITGAGSGIGWAISEAFSGTGARVLLHDINPAAAELAGKIGAEFLPADLANPAAVRDLAAVALQKSSGRVDVLVNNAGFQHVANVEEFPEEIWTTMIQVMLVAPFQLIRTLIPGMKQQGWGRIVNVASIHAVVASPFKSAYISAKHGLLGLTRCIALEAAPFGVTVNAICPAYVRTPLVEKQIVDQAKAHGLTADEVVEKIMLEPAAIKRLIEPREVAEFVLYLCTDAAGIITGSAQMLDLGWTAR